MRSFVEFCGLQRDVLDLSAYAYPEAVSLAIHCPHPLAILESGGSPPSRVLQLILNFSTRGGVIGLTDMSVNSAHIDSAHIVWSAERVRRGR